MRGFLYLPLVAILGGAMAMIALAPDLLSMAITAVMLVVLAFGVVIGLLPCINTLFGLRRGVEVINETLSIQTESMWLAIFQRDDFFDLTWMEDVFYRYKERVRWQHDSGQLMGDIEDYINDEVISNRCWNGVVRQIPGTLTGLGIMGTFIGLITGIANIGFSSVNAALSSVQTLLSGIEVAFYTSIAGVILSISFNILTNILWNILLRELGLFLEEFHREVIPPVEEQRLYMEQRNYRKILERLDRLPKKQGFSIGAAAPTSGSYQSNVQEQTLMPQIIEGMRKGEFIFYLQPKYDLTTLSMVSAEAFVRWKHEKLGMMSPGVFLPILESNGYITKLDAYLWEQVCQTLKGWVEQGARPLPISVNVSKTDILAIDMPSFWKRMIEEYQISPRLVELEVARNVVSDSHGISYEIMAKLRQLGFKVVLDGFDGNFFALEQVDHIEVDELKLDLRVFEGKADSNTVREIFNRASFMGLPITTEGIETAEQVTMLRRSGCQTGQGYYFSKPVSKEEYFSMMMGGRNES